MDFVVEIIIFLFLALLFVLISWIFLPAIQSTSLGKKDIFVDSLIVSDSGVVDTNTTVFDDGVVDISVIMPAYNEEQRLPGTLKDTIRYLEEFESINKLTFEIIVVDDGSKDKTSEIVMKNMETTKSLRLLKLVKNCGKGGAVMRGVLRSRGKYVLMADADGATDIRDLQKLYDSIQTSQITSLLGIAGAAIGSRAHLEKNATASRAWYRTILMYGLHLVVMILCTLNVRDTQCGFKLFTRATARRVFPVLHLQRWSFDMELIFLLEQLRIPITEVAVRWEEIPGSKLIQKTSDIVFVSINMLRDLLCMRLSYLLGIWSARNPLEDLNTE